jgi:tRNA uridine 5-carbamoylmethylation protein Kti12
METNIVLMIICGCPGTGKTYFTSKLKEYLETTTNYQLLHITFDKIINSKLEKLIIDIDFWKESRILIQNLIKLLISYLKIVNKNYNNNQSDYFNQHKINLFQNSTNMNNINEEIFSSFVSLVNMQLNNSNGFKNKYILCLDDNMYYESMRFKYYQLARQETCSYYCICFKIKKLDNLLKLNQIRSSSDDSFRITDTIIENMFLKFNYPDLVRWEKDSCLIIEYDEFFEIEGLFLKVLDTVGKLFESCNLAGCLTNEILTNDGNVNIKHQSDLIFRRLVKQCIESGDKNNNKNEFARNLNKIKNDVLEKLSKKNDDLYVKLDDLFRQNLFIFESYLSCYFLNLTKTFLK